MARRPAEKPNGPACASPAGVEQRVPSSSPSTTWMRKQGLNPAAAQGVHPELWRRPRICARHANSRAARARLFSRDDREPIRRRSTATETLRVLEDYKPLDVECASMGLALCRGIRARYPEWKLLVDGDGGDENLKDYPIEEKSRADDRSVVNKPDALPGRLGGWSDQAFAHLQRRAQPKLTPATYAPARHCGFEGFSPLHGRPLLPCRGDPLRDAEQYVGRPALLAQGRNRAARHQGPFRRRPARLREAPVPARAIPVEQLRRRLARWSPTTGGSISQIYQ